MGLLDNSTMEFTEEQKEYLETLYKEKLDNAFIPKARFNEVNDKAKANATKLNDLEKQVGQFQETIADRDREIESLKEAGKESENTFNKKLEELNTTFKYKEQLLGKVYNVDDVISKLDKTKTLEEQLPDIESKYPHYFIKGIPDSPKPKEGGESKSDKPNISKSMFQKSDLKNFSYWK